MLLLVIRHPTCASCVAWMCCRMSNSIKHAWACPDQSSRCGHRFLIAIMLLLMLRHPTCASYIAWMCCRMSDSIKHVWACPDLSSRRGHWFVIAIMLLIVLRHPTCASCVPWMCCRMSNSIKHVWACPDLSFDRLVLYTFLHSLRSIFSPSRPLQLLVHVTYTSPNKAVEGATALFVCLSDRTGW